MKVYAKEPPRQYRPRPDGDVVVRDCGVVELAPGEQVTLRTERGAEHEVTRTSWGFYATASIDARLARNGLRAVLARNETGRHYVLLVEIGREETFERYLSDESMEVVTWLEHP